MERDVMHRDQPYLHMFRVVKFKSTESPRIHKSKSILNIVTRLMINFDRWTHYASFILQIPGH